MVVTLFLDIPETRPAQSVQLKAHWIVLSIGNRVNIRLLAHTDLVTESSDGPAIREDLQGQVIIAHVSQPVAVV